MHPTLTTRPLTAANFTDLESLFAQKGCSFARSCWCMSYRKSGAPKPPAGETVEDFNKGGLRDLATSGPPPGLIGYDEEGVPIGWVTLGPRETFQRVQRSQVMKAVDDTPVWSIVCFVVPSPQRGRGVAKAMLDHAITFARQYGAQAVEAYPIDKPERSQPQWLWHGTRSMFDAAGFVEIARRKPTRPVMRLGLT